MDKQEIIETFEKCVKSQKEQVEWAKRWQSQTVLVGKGWTVAMIDTKMNIWTVIREYKNREYMFLGEPTTAPYFSKEWAQKLADAFIEPAEKEIRIIHKNELAEMVLRDYPDQIAEFEKKLAEFANK